jgi:3-deoxy-D-manno-octulosonate 8-phosphate phosphatase (KDO 8-P phosphatase)
MGDDLPDVPLLAACGLALTVPHAPDAVKRHAHYVTRRDGGAGAVREAAELILAAQSRLAEAEAAHGALARGG